MKKWIDILYLLGKKEPAIVIMRKYRISLEDFNKYIQIFYDYNYIVLVYNSNFQLETYRITNKGISVLKANNLLFKERKKKHGKAPKNPKKATTSSQGNPEGNANSAKLPRNYR